MTTASEAEREVEASRNNLDRTVEALKDKMTAGQLFDEAARMMGSGGQQIASKFMEQAKANPMPLAVMGVGLAWLMSSSGRGGGHAPSEPRSFSPSSGGSGMGSSMRRAGDAASDLMSSAKDRVAGMADAVADRGHAVTDALKAAPDQAREMAGAYADKAQRTFAQVLDSEPLLVGAVGFVVGAALGAALPHTDLEDQTVGPLRDKLVEKGKDMAAQGVQQAGEAVQAAYEGVKDELANSQPEDGAADRLEAAARAGVSAARDAIQTP